MATTKIPLLAGGWGRLIWTPKVYFDLCIVLQSLSVKYRPVQLFLFTFEIVLKKWPKMVDFTIFLIGFLTKPNDRKKREWSQKNITIRKKPFFDFFEIKELPIKTHVFFWGRSKLSDFCFLLFQSDDFLQLVVLHNCDHPTLHYNLTSEYI